MGQEATIKGTVLDENGASMVGVYVSYGDYKKEHQPSLTDPSACPFQQVMI